MRTPESAPRNARQTTVGPNGLVARMTCRCTRRPSRRSSSPSCGVTLDSTRSMMRVTARKCSSSASSISCKSRPKSESGSASSNCKRRMPASISEKNCAWNAPRDSANACRAAWRGVTVTLPLLLSLMSASCLLTPSKKSVSSVSSAARKCVLHDLINALATALGGLLSAMSATLDASLALADSSQCRAPAGIVVTAIPSPVDET